jgi:redox-sensitive bicupin YhaK (pirin superfamily)
MVPFGQIDNGFTVTYNLKKEGNGVYAFILSGQLNIDGQELETRDGFGIWDTNSFDIKSKHRSY